MNNRGFFYIGAIILGAVLVLGGVGYLVYENYIDVDVSLDCSVYKDSGKISECCTKANEGKFTIQCVGDWIIDENKQCKFECAQQVIEVCTEDAKICPDGSSVGRNPEDNCEFYACP